MWINVLRNPEAVYAAKYLQIPAVGLWTFAGPGGMVGVVKMFLHQSGIPLEEVYHQIDACQPMKDSICRLQKNYDISFDFRTALSPMGFLSTMCDANVNLITTIEDFQDDFPAELSQAYSEAGAKFEYVGPLLESEVPGLAEEALRVLAVAHEARQAGRKVVLASMGTILVSDMEELGWNAVPRDGSEQPRGLTGKQLCQAAWSAVFDAFGGSEESEDAPLLLVAVGRQPDALTDIDIPNNALCLPVLPQVPLLKASVDMFLTHGAEAARKETFPRSEPFKVSPTHSSLYKPLMAPPRRWPKQLHGVVVRWSARGGLPWIRRSGRECHEG